MTEKQKPFMGQIRNWKRVINGLGYAIYGKDYEINGIEYGPIQTSQGKRHE